MYPVCTPMTPNMPLQQAIPPQGHWCNIEAPTRRRACC